jgi:hypothetical protein
MRPIFPAPKSANHSAPSGPDVMPYGSLPDVEIGYSVTVPAVVILPT